MKKLEKLQSMCRNYLKEIKNIAKHYGLKDFVTNMIVANKNGDCKADVDDVEMLARIVNDDRIKRTEIPKILGLSYRQCVDQELFENIDRVDERGTYSRVSTELFKCELENNKCEEDNG